MIDPSLIEKHKTVLISKFGIQGIRNGTWHNVGKIKEFDRADWPIPLFLRHTEPFPPRLVQYNDDLDEIEDKKAPPNIDVSSYYRAGLDGSGAIEIRMTGLIDGNTGFIDGNN